MPTSRRAVLVAPASDERKAIKALESDADEVVLDLEDAVPPDRKVAARALIYQLISTGRRRGTIAVRINAISSAWGADDLAACARASGLDSIVIPKAESAQNMLEADRALSGTNVKIQALVETPSGVQNLAEITTATTRLVGLIIGYADLGAALGRTSTAPHEQWLSIQSAVLVAARAADIDAIDGPHLGITADDRFLAALTWTRDLGFDGKWIIHPTQINDTIAAFTPSPVDVDNARQIIAELAAAAIEGRGAARLNGQMLDEAVAVAARRVLRRAGQPTDR
ncbi:citrate lyase [Mycolicibacterium mucogenicum]|uniref:Citrate lyase n=1 Tax=Mycolicibacterium mucogenicum TaxID=56689 RepID=A0A1A3HFR3_MYCMU|nr:CoA ester lyase [Mycolicibacterium mucogenicum]OBJ46463.1 citrate lyase [Mycolicibacterium mucogenicum]